MRVGKYFLTVLLTILFLLLLTTPRSYAATRNVGVSVGNSFKHTATFSWNSTDPNATMPSYYETANETEGTSVSITGVSGTIVTLNMTMHFKNGTDQVGTDLIADIDTGDGNVTYWLVAANLGVNDSIYTSAIFSPRCINETVTRSYPNGPRSVNHLNITTESNTTGSYLYTSQNVYWDKATGVMIEMVLAMITQTNASREIMSSTSAITESNVWVVPEFPTLTPILTVLTLLATTILFGKKKIPKA